MIYILRCFNDGGVETLVKRLLHCSEKEIKIIITSDEISNNGKNFLLEHNVNYEALGKNTLLQVLFSIKFWKLILQNHRIIFWYEELAIIALFKFWGISKVHIGIGLQKNLTAQFFNLLLRIVASIKPQCLVCASYQVKSTRKLPAPVKVIHNYVPIQNVMTPQAKDNNNKLLFIGRWELIKNIEYLERLMVQIGSSYELDVVGDSTKRSTVKNINFCGIKDRPFDNDASCLIFFPHSVEGFGLVLIEALVNGKKVITWNRNVAGELLKSSDQVLFIDPENYNISDIIDFMQKKIENVSLMDSLAYCPTQLETFVYTYT